MMKTTLSALSCIGLLVSMTACGNGAPEVTTVTETVTATTAASVAPAESSSAPSSTAPPSEVPTSTKASVTSQPPSSEAPRSDEEIPEGLHGKWLDIGDAQDWPACSTIEDPSSFVEIDATTVSFFAVSDTLETVEQNDGTTFVGRFTYQSDGDNTGASHLKLEQVNEKVMEFTDLDDEFGAVTYGRC